MITRKQVLKLAGAGALSAAAAIAAPRTARLTEKTISFPSVRTVVLFTCMFCLDDRSCSVPLGDSE